VAWSPDHATAPTEGLLFSRGHVLPQEETFGQPFRRGRKTRAEQLSSPPAGSPRRSAGLQTSRPGGKSAATGGLVPPGQYFQRTRRLKNIARSDQPGGVARVEGWSRVLVSKHRSGGASPPGTEPTNPQDVERRAQVAKAPLCDVFVPGMILATATRTLLARERTRGNEFRLSGMSRFYQIQIVPPA